MSKQIKESLMSKLGGEVIKNEDGSLVVGGGKVLNEGLIKNDIQADLAKAKTRVKHAYAREDTLIRELDKLQSQVTEATQARKLAEKELESIEDEI